MILRNHHDRYRTRARERFWRLFGVAVLLGGIGSLGFSLGRMQNANDVVHYRQAWENMQQSSADQTTTLQELQTNFRTLQMSYDQLLQRYEQDVPTGDLGLLASLVAEQLAKGTSAERLAFVIREAQPPQNCSSPISRRFIVNTPNYKGPRSMVSFADGAITVQGEGQSARSPTNTAESWFDPGKQVQIQFTLLGGETKSKKGLLPLHETIVLNGKEHRFTIAEGPRSFVVVTSDTCDYPLALQKLQQRHEATKNVSQPAQ